MAKNHHVHWAAHPNLYNNNCSRKLNIYFAEPDKGVNEETGLLLLIPGFGANAQSNVYKKMRTVFADKYNLVTIQCDYFGQEYMQDSQSVALHMNREILKTFFKPAEIDEIYKQEFNPKKFIEIGSRYNISVTMKESLNESLDNFNDMGLMQSIDHLTAINYVIKILKDNNLHFNTKKIIAYGQSQGAFLSYLCNALDPHLFSLIIDNSAWLYPKYLSSPRFLYKYIGEMTIQIEFDYLAKSMEHDKEFLNLQTLYGSFINKCSIESFHGNADLLINYLDKKKFCESVNNCTYHEISEANIDGVIFKSNQHGLNADFLKLFDHVFMKHKFNRSKELKLLNNTLKTENNVYKLTYSDGIPILSVRGK